MIDRRTTYPGSAALDRVADAGVRPATARLRRLGWTFGLTDAVRPASAVCNPYAKQIVCRQRVARNGRRDRLYVIPHEVGHALDYEAGGRIAGDIAQHARPSIALAGILGITPAAAQEALAEAVAYQWRKRSEQRRWILTAIRWKISKGIRYRWSHVRHPVTVELADLLLDGPRHYLGVHWTWAGDRILPV